MVLVGTLLVWFPGTKPKSHVQPRARCYKALPKLRIIWACSVAFLGGNNNGDLPRRVLIFTSGARKNTTGQIPGQSTPRTNLSSNGSSKGVVSGWFGVQKNWVNIAFTGGFFRLQKAEVLFLHPKLKIQFKNQKQQIIVSRCESVWGVVSCCE